MPAGFDLIEFAAFVRARALTLIVCCGVSTLAAGGVSLVLPHRYTATARILIGAPAGMDPRAATNISPVYLESLKTFEEVALSDSLFLQATEHLGLRQQYEARTIESLKNRVLRVSKPVNTRVIEIGATLEDPRKAQALAQYIAEQTVALSRSLDSQFSADMTAAAQTTFRRADERLQMALRASEESARKPAVEALAAELESARELKFRVDGDLGGARADLAELIAREPESDRRIPAGRARIAALEERDRDLEKTISATGAHLESLRQSHDAVEAELQAARVDFETAQTRLADTRAAAAFRGERLDVFDPGIVPERPSFPNIPLNILAAMFLSVIVCMFYLAFRFGYDRVTRAQVERAYSLR